MLLNPLTFHAPEKLSEALQLYSSLPNVRLQAGGTFLLNSLKLLKRKGAKTPEHVISLRKVKELKGIEADGEKMVIQSMTTITDIFESPLLTDNFAVLRTVCRNISTTPIRNMATVGGNLTCRYTWTEMPAVMIALEAALHFIGPDLTEEVVTAEDFFKGGAKTDKILRCITIQREPTATIAYQRVKKTMHVDIPLLSLCMKTNFKGKQFTNTRVCVNNCVVFAQRDRPLEDFLNQSLCSNKVATQALDHMDKTIYDTRSGDYKKHMFRICIKNAINDLVARRS